MGVAAAFILPFQAVGDPITALPCIDAAPWWRAGKLARRAAAWTADRWGWLRACERSDEVSAKDFLRITEEKTTAVNGGVLQEAHHSAPRPIRPHSR